MKLTPFPLPFSSRFQDTNFREPVTKLSDEQVENLKLRYYNPDVHRAAFVLPQFAKKVSTSQNKLHNIVFLPNLYSNLSIFISKICLRFLECIFCLAIIISLIVPLVKFPLVILLCVWCSFEHVLFKRSGLGGLECHRIPSPITVFGCSM